jgi:hypothetical protein
MITILNVSDTAFSLDGISYLKNFQGVVSGDSLKIVGIYDSKIELVRFTNFAEFTVGGVGFATVALLQAALLTVLYNRATLGTPDGTNVGEYLIGGFWVDKKANTNKLAIEVGDQIRGNLAAGRYIIADVTALPHTSETNLSIYLDNEK